MSHFLGSLVGHRCSLVAIMGYDLPDILIPGCKSFGLVILRSYVLFNIQ